uniref:dUTPase-like domain-containing protein n=1 Tax=Geospiza parvula TaxID=87175 RepID=A0A8U8BMF2_GEOPR
MILFSLLRFCFSHTAKLSVCDRYTGATRGLAGIDTPGAETVTILTRGICKVPLDAYGPIGQGLSAFLMGRSSSTIQGINIHLGLIDSDYMGQLQAIVSVSEPPVVIQKGTCIAQLVPFMSCVPTVVDQSHGTGGFGSTGPPQNNY